MVTAMVTSMVTTQLLSTNVSRWWGHFSFLWEKYFCFQVPVHNKVCTKEPVEVWKNAIFLEAVLIPKIFQSCDEVPKEVPVARKVCTKAPVQVRNCQVILGQDDNCWSHFRAAPRCQGRFAGMWPWVCLGLWPGVSATEERRGDTERLKTTVSSTFLRQIYFFLRQGIVLFVRNICTMFGLIL